MFKKSPKGFTILEIIAVLVIIGILAAIAVSRATNFDVEVQTGADTLKMHLRYAQTMAMNSNPNSGEATIWGISCDGTTYWLFNGIATGNVIRLPDDDRYINLSTKINLAAKKISVSSFTVFFDNRGIPYSAYPGTQWPGTAISVTPASGGGTTVNITIMPLTGYIQ